ncbi:MAG TPA: rRNA maturation RNase YbeY [Pyrinomonadaceae bacterium]|nr:rRNA maturation RNase YbeY [Pyrinomonadaceae bacterium]
MPATVINLQRKMRVETASLRDFAARVLSEIRETDGKTFSVALVSDSRMTDLNKLFRSKDSTTDVLSFPHEPDEFDPEKNNLGDIVISVEQAVRQAGENGLSLDAELKQLVLHGVLHLLGYDHETDKGEMNARELELRDWLRL